ncbi:MAG TPA: PIN domain-containing protein [Candidatus Brocadiaceae bacterium]
MAINYTIQADVVDIRQDIPKPDNIFLVDTNVWYWLTYTRAPKNYQTKDYPSYINKALSAKSQLHKCGLSLAELAHLIERTELEIFSKASGFDKNKKKEFRHNHPKERTNAVSEIQAAWGLVETMSQTIDIQINKHTTDDALSRLSTQILDGYDLFILESIMKAGVVKIITDDGDFSTVPNILVFTSNVNVIQAAKVQGKLLKR